MQAIMYARGLRNARSEHPIGKFILSSACYIAISGGLDYGRYSTHNEQYPGLPVPYAQTVTTVPVKYPDYISHNLQEIATDLLLLELKLWGWCRREDERRFRCERVYLLSTERPNMHQDLRT